jgi:hypothetical protein
MYRITFRGARAFLLICSIILGGCGGGSKGADAASPPVDTQNFTIGDIQATVISTTQAIKPGDSINIAATVSDASKYDGLVAISKFGKSPTATSAPYNMTIKARNIYPCQQTITVLGLRKDGGLYVSQDLPVDIEPDISSISGIILSSPAFKSLSVGNNNSRLDVFASLQNGSRTSITGCTIVKTTIADPSIIAIDDAGYLIPKKVGTTSIDFSVGSLTSSASITVVK